MAIPPHSTPKSWIQPFTTAETVAAEWLAIRRRRQALRTWAVASSRLVPKPVLWLTVALIAAEFLFNLDFFQSMGPR